MTWFSSPPAVRLALLPASLGLALGLLLLPACKRAETAAGEPGKAAATAAPAATAVAAAAPSPAAKTKGRWLRPDGGYILEIGAIDDGGRAEAGYFNPNPVRVAWATVRSGGDAAVKIEVELRDHNYPGCLYKLTYLPEKDQLVGTYFQAQAHQTYNVEFVRAP